MSENYINHIALVLDASISIGHLEREVIKVADAQIQYLAQRSQELDQETRVSVYTFGSDIQCVIFDKDVLRLPSIAKFYRATGRSTRLIDAVIKSQDDLEDTSQLYGDHAFLTYVITDGQENASTVRDKVRAMQNRLAKLSDNFTVAVFVPDQNGVFEAKSFGFPKDNIAIWDATSVRGLESAGETIRQTTDNFMTARSTGTFRGTRGLFSMDASVLNKQTVKTALTEVKKGDYTLLPAIGEGQIRDQVERAGIRYQLGKAFYQLTKTEEIQPHKQICVVEKKTNKVFTGREARNILGLDTNVTVKVRPSQNPDYDVFVQSTSVNRKILAGTKVLVMK